MNCPKSDLAIEIFQESNLSFILIQYAELISKALV